MSADERTRCEKELVARRIFIVAIAILNIQPSPAEEMLEPSSRSTEVRLRCDAHPEAPPRMAVKLDIPLRLVEGGRAAFYWRVAAEGDVGFVERRGRARRWSAAARGAQSEQAVQYGDRGEAKRHSTDEHYLSSARAE